MGERRMSRLKDVDRQAGRDVIHSLQVGRVRELDINEIKQRGRATLAARRPAWRRREQGSTFRRCGKRFA